jgi:hypothetical protein
MFNVAGLVFALTALFMLTKPGGAHQAPQGWTYDYHCCTDKDCAMINPATVVAVTGGWKVTVRPGDHPLITEPKEYLVPYDSNKVIESKDSDFHLCVGAYTKSLFCLYVPEMGM